MNWIEHLLRLDNETPARKTLKKIDPAKNYLEEQKKPG